MARVEDGEVPGLGGWEHCTALVGCRDRWGSRRWLSNGWEVSLRYQRQGHGLREGREVNGRQRRHGPIRVEVVEGRQASLAIENLRWRRVKIGQNRRPETNNNGEQLVTRHRMG